MTDCSDVLVPASAVSMSIVMKMERVYWHRHAFLLAGSRGLHLYASAQVRDATTNKGFGHTRAHWLRWANYSPPASFRLYCAHAPAGIIACHCPYGWRRFSFKGRTTEHAEWLSTAACWLFGESDLEAPCEVNSHADQRIAEVVPRGGSHRR